MCENIKGLSDILREKFKLQQNETLFLQYCKFIRNVDGSTDEWIGRLRIKTIEYLYKEKTKDLKHNV